MESDRLTKEEARISLPKADEVLALAARLQHEDEERVSLAEVERTACEAGIDPKYVRQALAQNAENARIRMVSNIGPFQPMDAARALLWLGFVGAMQSAVAMFYWGWDGMLLPAVLFAFLLGLAYRPDRLPRNLLALLGVSAATGFLILFRAPGSQMLQPWHPGLVFLILGVTVAMLAGQFLASRLLSPRTRALA